MNPALQKLVDKLQADAAVEDPWKLIKAYIAVDNAATPRSAKPRGAVLKSAIAWGGEGQALAAQALESTRRLAAIACRFPSAARLRAGTTRRTSRSSR